MDLKSFVELPSVHLPGTSLIGSIGKNRSIGYATFLIVVAVRRPAISPGPMDLFVVVD
jgi:hypothetical protein